MENKSYYVIYDRENVSERIIYGICTSMERVDKSVEWLTNKMTEECFAVDRKESGLNREYDYNRIWRECRDSIGIERFDQLDEVLY